MEPSLPSYRDLMLPVVRAVSGLGGSGNSREISESVIESEGFSEDLLAVTYEGREKSILVDRLDWARSYCKLGGVLESPKRGLFLITDLGREIAALPDPEAHERLKEIDHAVRRARRRNPKSDAHVPPDDDGEGPPEDDERWKEVLLARLHKLSPDAFEHFVLYRTPSPRNGTQTCWRVRRRRCRRNRQGPPQRRPINNNRCPGKALRPLENRRTRNRCAVSK